MTGLSATQALLASAREDLPVSTDPPVSSPMLSLRMGIVRREPEVRDSE
jgi:hypothetical protein